MGEDNCIAEVSDVELVNEVTGADEQTDCFNDGECDDEVSLPPIQSQLQAAATCKRLCDAFNVNSTLRRAVYSLQKEIRLQRLFTVRQTTLDEWKK